ncbi:hypothetical protein BD779DRAFT_1795845 [Infundibulicybe gibba]|nr:hypothetical protein BD779DRAFT_1795845 [Infundibulicybe gibba]
MPALLFTFSNVYGSLEICVMLSGILNGFLASQMISYFRNFRHDPTILKASIALIWAANIASFGCSCWILYTFTMTQHQAPLTEISIPTGSFSATIMLEIVVRCMTQGIYTYRMFKFSHQIWLLIPCCALALFEFGLALTWATSVASLRNTLLIASWSSKFKWIVDALFTTGALLDLVITTSICYQLKQNRILGLKRTKDLIDTIIRWTIQSGLITCVVAIVVLIVWAINPTSNLWLGISMCLTDCYAMMLMALMNGRMRLKNDAENHITLTTSISIVGGATNSTHGSSELNPQLAPMPKFKPSNLVTRAGAEEFGLKA